MNQLSRVIDALPGMVWTVLPDGQTDFINQRWCEFTGIDVDAAIGHGWQIAIHPEDLPPLLGSWRSIHRSGEFLETKARLRRFDGEYRWFLLRTSPVGDAADHAVTWCTLNADTEDRGRNEEAQLEHWWLRLPTRETHFRSVADSIPGLACLITQSGGIELVNRQTLDYFGMTIEELKDPTVFTKVIHPDDVEAVMAGSRQAIATGDAYDFEHRLRRADGLFRWFQTRAFPLHDNDGHVVLWYLVQMDIDDRKRAEALLVGEKRLLEMVAAGEALPVVLDEICRLVEETANDCRCGILFFHPSGATWDRAVGPALPSGYNQAMHGRPAHRASGPCGLAAALKTSVIVSDVLADARWETHGWRTLALKHGLRSCWSSPILSQGQEALGALAIYRSEPGSPTPFQLELIAQVSRIASIAVERARGEDALKRSEAFLLEAQRLSSTGSFSWHVASNEIIWSEQAFRIFGMDRNVPATLEIIRSRVHPDDAPAFYEMIRQAQGGDVEYEYRIQLPDGSVKYVCCVAHGTRDRDGQLEYIGAIQDITERRRAEEALDKARSELAHVARVTSLSALTASIAHEVNQPLSGIITNASTCLRMLATDPPNIDGALETARRTIRDGNRASDVIKRLRALFSNKSTTTETVDLNEATREVIALSWSELQRSRVIMRTDFADFLPPITGDRVQLQQVILNLLLNALEAMSEIEDRPRRMVIRTKLDNTNAVCLSMQDVGAGFDPQGAEKLFEAFYTTKNGGMGIGLSVSRSIIESHGGRLWADINEGPGATFSFSIPRNAENMTRTRVGRIPPVTATKQLMRNT